jgi:hypothetical protein
MNPAQQIAKLKGHVLIFSNELRSLIQSFELLFLAAENQEDWGTNERRAVQTLFSRTSSEYGD